jgi:hypothetical protein
LIAGDHGAAAQAVAVLAALLLGHGRPAPEAGRDIDFVNILAKLPAILTQIHQFMCA